MASSSVEAAMKEVAAAREQVARASAKPSNHVVWTPEMIQFLTIAVLVFTFLSLVMCCILLYKKDANGAQILKVFGIVIIVAMSSILLIIGYSNEQLTPIVGLFGAIAGYLLGKDATIAGRENPASTAERHEPKTSVPGS